MTQAIKTVKSAFTDAQLSMMKAYITLNQIMPRHSINVSHICKEAHVARSTFYVYYDNVDMMLEDIEEAELYQIVTITERVTSVPLQQDMMAFITDTMRYMQQHKSLYYTFLIHEPNYRFITRWKQEIRIHLEKRVQELHLQSTNQDLLFEIIAAQVITLYSYFLVNPYDVSDEDIHKIAIHGLQLLNL